MATSTVEKKTLSEKSPVPKSNLIETFQKKGTCGSITSIELAVFSPKELSALKVARIKSDTGRVVFEGYQRILSPSNLKKIITFFENAYHYGGVAYLTEPIFLAKRKNGDIYILDGQHRAEAAIQCNLSLFAVVVSGLEIDDERKYFTVNNLGKQPSAADYLRNLMLMPEGRDLKSVYDLFEEELPGFDNKKVISLLNFFIAPMILNSQYAAKDRVGAVKFYEQIDVVGMKTYLRQCLRILTRVFSFENTYLKPLKTNNTILSPFQCTETLYAAFDVIVHFHRILGNTKETDQKLVDLFSRVNWQMVKQQGEGGNLLGGSSKSSTIYRRISCAILMSYNYNKKKDRVEFMSRDDDYYSPKNHEYMVQKVKKY